MNVPIRSNPTGLSDRNQAALYNRSRFWREVKLGKLKAESEKD